MMSEPTLQQLNTEITVNPHCGHCRRFPGNGEICEERGRPVRRNNTAKRYCFEAMTPGELKARLDDVKAKQKEYRERPDVKAKQKEYRERPDVKAKKKEYRERPDVKAKQKEYRERPDVKAKQKEYFQRPDVKAKQKEKLQTRAALKALEKLRSVNPTLYEKLIHEAPQEVDVADLPRGSIFRRPQQ